MSAKLTRISSSMFFSGIPDDQVIIIAESLGRARVAGGDYACLGLRWGLR